jgi:hypothetical protein
MEPDQNYFARRSREEWTAARLAIDPTAQSRHVDLAVRYEELAVREDALSLVRLNAASVTPNW